MKNRICHHDNPTPQPAEGDAAMIRRANDFMSEVCGFPVDKVSGGEGATAAFKQNGSPHYNPETGRREK